MLGHVFVYVRMSSETLGECPVQSCCHRQVFLRCKADQVDIVRKTSQDVRCAVSSFRGEASSRFVTCRTFFSRETTLPVSTSFRRSTSRFIPRVEERISDRSWGTSLIIVEGTSISPKRPEEKREAGRSVLCLGVVTQA